MRETSRADLVQDSGCLPLGPEESADHSLKELSRAGSRELKRVNPIRMGVYDAAGGMCRNFE